MEGVWCLLCCKHWGSGIPSKSQQGQERWLAGAPSFLPAPPFLTGGNPPAHRPSPWEPVLLRVTGTPSFWVTFFSWCLHLPLAISLSSLGLLPLFTPSSSCALRFWNQRELGPQPNMHLLFPDFLICEEDSVIGRYLAKLSWEFNKTRCSMWA